MDSAFLGMVQYFAFDWAPKRYALCNGALLAINQNAALFSLLGTYYGGNGTSTFALPDLRGRSVVGMSNSYTLGEKFGTTSVTMQTTNMPVHTHTVPAVQMPAYNATPRTGGDSNDPTNCFPSIPANPATMYSAAADTTFLGAPTATVGNAGSAQPISTQNPYLVITACIATQGIFPSRN
jgi:microcystin-dependent protein